MARARTARSAFRDLADALGDERAVPDVGWIAALSQRPEAEVHRVLAELAAFVPMERAIRQTLRGGGREFYAQLNAPFDVFALTRLLAPHHIVELGVSSGISSTHFLLGLRQNRGDGRLHSIDLPTFQRAPVRGSEESAVSIPPGRRSGWAVPAELRGAWDLRIGRTERLLAGLVGELPAIDLFLHDDRHTPEHLAFELRTVRPKLRPGSVVLADNTNWTGDALDRFAHSIHAEALTKRGSHLRGLRVPVRGARTDV
jgi:Methyltransferase domain